MPGSTKERSEQIKAAAMELVDAPAVDNIHDTDTRKKELVRLAQELEARMGCTYKTARQHIARAMRRKRHPEYTGPGSYRAAGWGGKREHAGRPTEVLELRTGKKLMVLRNHAIVGSGTIIEIDDSTATVKLDGHDEHLVITVGHAEESPEIQED